MSAGKEVSFKTSRGNASGYLAESKQKQGGVIVIQEWWGLVPHIKDIAGRFAGEGYVALAPDLYHGESTLEAAEAQHLMTGLDWGRAAEEITGAVRYLRERQGAQKVGVVGFCMGGALTVIAAAVASVDAYAAFYGFPQKGAAPIDDISAPGLIFFGEEETFFSVPDAQAFAERQQKKGRWSEVVIYPGAGHAFFNDTRETYHAVAAADSWKRTLELFAKQLR